MSKEKRRKPIEKRLTVEVNGQQMRLGEVLALPGGQLLLLALFNGMWRVACYMSQLFLTWEELLDLKKFHSSFRT